MDEIGLCLLGWPAVLLNLNLNHHSATFDLFALAFGFALTE
jgi:hypothetical protein